MTEEHALKTAEAMPIIESMYVKAVESPMAQFANAETVVGYMADKCKGPRFLSNIQGRSYPRVEWWTTVGFALGLSPLEVSNVRLDREGQIVYEAVVEVQRMNDGMIISRGSALCSSEESAWGNRDEYAIKSMAATRATGKAYRIGLSFLAVMAGVEPTPADEVPPQGFDATDKGHGVCEAHGVALSLSAKQREFGYPASHRSDDGYCSGMKSGPSEARTDAEATMSQLWDGNAERSLDWLTENFPEYRERGSVNLVDAEWDEIKALAVEHLTADMEIAEEAVADEAAL